MFGCQVADLVRLAQNSGGVRGDHLGVHHAVLHNLADFQDVLAKRLAFLGDQGGIGGDAVHDAQGDSLADFVQVCGIQKDFHDRRSFYFWALRCRRATAGFISHGATTGLRKVPTPSTTTSTTSPACRGPTPDGVPVEMTSPGSSVIMREIQWIEEIHGKQQVGHRGKLAALAVHETGDGRLGQIHFGLDHRAHRAKRVKASCRASIGRPRAGGRARLRRLRRCSRVRRTAHCSPSASCEQVLPITTAISAS